MKRILIAIAVLTITVVPVADALAIGQATPKSPGVSKPAGGGAFAVGVVEGSDPSNPAVLILKVTDVSDNVRSLEVNGSLRIEFPPEYARRVATLKSGKRVRVNGFVKNGRFIATSVSLSAN